MKRYLLFQFDDYYPSGGWKDFTGDFDSITDALTNRANDPQGDLYQLVDTQLKQVIESN